MAQDVMRFVDNIDDKIEQNSIWVQALLVLLHLNLKTGPLCPVIRNMFKGALFLCQSSRVPPEFHSYHTQGPKRRNPLTHVSVRPRPHTHTSATVPTGGVTAQSHYV